MITKLTKEQEAILPRNRDKFIKSALTFSEIPQDRCNSYIDWLYSLCEFAPPIKVYVSSPYAAQLKANELNGTKNKYYDFSLYTSIWYQSWYAYYQTMIDLGVKLDEKFVRLLEFDGLGIYSCIQFDTHCIICERPTKVVRNGDNLHNPSGSAIEWRDGYKLYYINGRNLPAWIWEKAAKGEITKELFLKEKNAEIKAGMYAVLGQKKVKELFNTVDIDTQTIKHSYGEEIVILTKTKETYKDIDNQPFAWVIVKCPSTSTEYMLGVEPKHTDAVEALASTFGMTGKEYILTKAS